MKELVLIIFSVIIVSQTNNLYAHKRAKYNIVIDTDAGIDDFRAITYFCASKDFNINCISTVDGVLEPQIGAEYISRLLNVYHHEGVPIGTGSNFEASKQYSKHALFYWEKMFKDIIIQPRPPAIDLLDLSIKNEKGRTIIIALGPLSNIAELLEKYPENAMKIETILWYCNFTDKPDGYNYKQNIKAYEYIIKTKVPLKMFSGSEQTYMEDFLQICNEINSVYAKTLSVFFAVQTKHSSYYWDELSALYLLYPTIFQEDIISDFTRKITLKSGTIPDILVTSILNSDKPDEGVVFNEIPISGYMLKTDIDNISQQLIEKHGYAEFKIVSLTSEIHSHMGIYSILGAKTGLRIMEYLHAGLDEIELISYAGFTPPISCFNDGLQVGTGSTIGYGTISVDTELSVRPAVLVKYNGREILFSIKQEIIKKAENDVSQLIKAHGLESEMYWIKLREISILNYWLELSRFDILEIEEIK
ncbi:MAG TPA: nucleoside hydrolase [Bacteroidales bacterium]|nr:nucleoside hydrolase [Bacteroidales bacterium]